MRKQIRSKMPPIEVATQVRAVEDSIEAALAEIAELQSANGSRAMPSTGVAS